MLCADTLRPADYSFLNWKMIEPDTEGNIYWHIVNFTPDQPKHKTLLAFTKAFDIWQQAFDNHVMPVGRYITFKPTADFHQAHIRLFFMNPRVKQQQYKISDGTMYTLRNDWPFKGPLGVLAHRPPNKHEIHFDESERWSDIHKYEKEGNQWTLYVHLMAVALHEIGHICDLGHSTVANSLMFASYDGKKLGLAADDYNGLNRKWTPIKSKVAAFIKSKAPAPIVADDSGDLITQAFKFYGLKEVDGPDSEPTIIRWIKDMFPTAVDDSKVAWCSIFMNAIAKLSGYEHTNNAMAKSWLKIGKEISWEDRDIGDVAIFNRGKDPRFGHVAMYINDRGDDLIRVLGGNQQNAVNIRSYSRSRLVGFRRLSKL